LAPEAFWPDSNGNAVFRRIPSRRALAAFAKLHGFRLERRWPFLIRAEGRDLNLNFEDVLEYQYSRSRDFTFVSVGAYDGLTNDPIGRFVRSHDCRGILLEPQSGAYARLCANYSGFPQCRLLNAAIDEVSGTRTLYYVPSGNPGFPGWTEQIASFQLEHVTKHEAEVPGLSACVRSREIRTLSFGDLLDQCALRAIDVLQIDAEGMDGQLIGWFPFERLRPAVLHYETTHLSPAEHAAVRARLEGFGYLVREADSSADDMAVMVGE
jgi:FkbM family methyltransferase